MPSGFVTRWLDHRNFGFVVTEGGGEDVFVHGSVLVGADSLVPGDRVEYELDSAKAKLTAKICRKINKETPSQSLFPQGDESTGVYDFLSIAGVKPRDQESTYRLLRPFIAFSSVRCPFLVISQAGLVEGLAAPSPAELATLLALLRAYTEGCEGLRSHLLADFEGEMLGHCGELTTAALLPTPVLDSELKPLSVHRSHLPLGLLLDLRSTACIDAFRPLMESEKVVKLMWGADSDFEGLMHQEMPIRLKVLPQAVVDVQLAFSSGERRLGMAKMLERLPKSFIERLPDKQQIDWHAYHSQNKRALHLPMQVLEATYAMDDLHRIEAILATQRPSSSSYTAARSDTARVLREVQADPCGWRSLLRNEGFYHKSLGNRKLSCAVRLVRHILNLRYRETMGLDLGHQKEQAWKIEEWATAELAKAGVLIPADLSFANDVARPRDDMPVARKPKRPLQAIWKVLLCILPALLAIWALFWRA